MIDLNSFHNSFSDLNAIKDDSTHKAVVFIKEIKKRKMAERAEILLEKISLLLLPVKNYIWNPT